MSSDHQTLHATHLHCRGGHQALSHILGALGLGPTQFLTQRLTSLAYLQGLKQKTLTSSFLTFRKLPGLTATFPPASVHSVALHP